MTVGYISSAPPKFIPTTHQDIMQFSNASRQHGHTTDIRVVHLLCRRHDWARKGRLGFSA